MKKRFTYVKILLVVAVVLLLAGTEFVVRAGSGACHLTYIDCNTMEESSIYTNYFVVGFNRDMSKATDWKMTYTDGQTQYVTSKAVPEKQIEDRDEKAYTTDVQNPSTGSTMVFYLKQKTGEYEITSISFRLDDREICLDVEKEALREKNVDRTFTVQPTEEELASYEEKAGAMSRFLLPRASSNENVFLEGEIRLLSTSIKKATESGKTVIMLDPGHGGYSGANRTYDGVKYYEDELCLQIANACKEELMKNGNVEVYLTRTTNVNMALAERAKLAYSQGACMLVSLHLNATDAVVVGEGASATGAEVIYQNGNYNAVTAAWSQSLAQNIVDELAALGLKKRGIYYKNATSLKYPDGSLADYFAINREAKLLGMPGIIVEHCFLNNSWDFATYLATPEKTAQLGAADARGILKFIEQNSSGEGDSAQPDAPTKVIPSAMSKMRVKVSFQYTGEGTPTGYELYRADSKDGTYEKIADGTAGAVYIIDTTGEAGKTYYYKVRAVKAGLNGTLYSEFSKVVSYTFLNTPTYVSGIMKSDGSFTLKWNNVAGATGCQVSRSDNPTGPYTELAKVTGNSFTDTTADGKTYYYKIRAYSVLEDRTAYSYYSDARMPGTRVESAKRASSSTTLLQWKAAENMTGYRIYRKAQGESSYKLLKEVDSSTLRYLDEDVTEEKSYQYNVRAVLKTSAGNVLESFGSVVTVQASLTTPVVNKAQPVSKGPVTITWSASEGADGYYIYRLEQASEEISSGNRLAEVSGDTLSYVDSTAKTGHAYLYAVQAYQIKDGKTETSFADQMALSGTVIKAVLSYSATGIRIGWDKLDNVDGYRVYRSTTKATGYKLIKTLGKDAVSCVDSTVSQGTTYYYRVRPYRDDKVQDAVGTEQSIHFLCKNYNSASGTIKQAPQLNEAALSSEKELQVSWSEVSGATGYQIYRSEKEDGTYTRIAKVAGGKNTQYKDAEITATKTYYYKVRAYFLKNGFYGYTPYSGIVSSGLKLTSVLTVNSESIKLSWEKAAGFDAVRIYRKKSSESSYKLVATAEMDKENYTDTGLEEGVKYDYKLVCCKESNGSTITGAALIVTAATLSKPESESARVGSTGDIYVRWKQASGATGYEIFRSETGKSGSFQKIATVSGGTKESYKDTTAKEKKIYYYKVRAFATDGDKTSYSGYSKIQISGVGACRVQAVSSITVNVSWEEVAGAKSYELWTKRPGETSYTSLGVFEPGATTYKDSGLTAGAKYEYRVTVSDGTYTSYVSYANAFTLIGKVAKLSVAVSDKYDGLTLTWQKVSDAESYMIYRKAAGESEYTKIAIATDADTLTYTDKTVQGNLDYTYKVRALKYVAGVAQYGSYSNTAKACLTLTKVMGVSQATKEQIVAYYNRSGKTYPKIYADEAYGAVATIEDFVQIIMEEAAAEGVRADLLAAQVFKETGYLQFGGDVKASQCNFGGIGAVGGGAKGATFPDVRTGLRAQVQHLKAYGDKNAVLVYQCVDPRFQYVTKGCAEYIEWLGIQENPSGKGWATAAKYGISLVSMMNTMKGM